MASIQKVDLVNVDLNTGNINRSFYSHAIGLKDNQGDAFGVRVFRDGEPVILTGASVQGVFMPPQGSPIAITSGNSVSGNEAYVVLPQACYNYEGQFTLAIKLVASGVTGTMRIVDGVVSNTHASGTVAPTSAVPTYQEVLSVYEQAIAAINKTVRFDATQSLTDTQKATARTNIDAASVGTANELAMDIGALAEGSANNSYIDLGNKWMPFRRGYYSTPAVGSASSYQSNSQYFYALVMCQPGDILHAHCYGNSTVYAWAFLDSNLNVLSRGGTGNFEGTQTAPASTSYVLVNVDISHMSTGFYAWVGKESTGEKISDLKSAFMQYNGVTDKLNINEYEKGSITTTTGENSTYRQNARARTKVVTKAPFDFVLAPFNTSGESTDYYTEVVFYNDDGTWNSHSDQIHEGSTLTITKGQNFRLLIADSNRTASTSVISLEDLVGHIKITSTFGIDFQEMKESLYGGVLHFAYSNKNATTLTANTNIDNLSAGNYLCMSSDVASTLTGLPVAMQKATFRLMVLNAPSSIKLWVIIPRYRSEIYIKKTSGKWIIVGTENQHAFISASRGSDTNAGNSANPFKTIGYALSSGYRKLKVEPGVYNEKISVEGGDIEIIPWVDDQSYSASNAPYRPKIKIIKGTKLTVSATETTGVYQASYTAESGTNIYKVFVDHSVDPTTAGSLSTEYNALLVGDMPNTSTSSKAFSPYRQQFYTPVLTETELSTEGTFWYDGTNNLIKFHAWNDTADGEYYIPDDDADTGISLTKMEIVHLEDVKVLGFYDNCININKCDNVTINACEVGYCAKGMGLKLDYTNARVSDCHAYAISVDGYNLHGYGYSEIVGCTAFYCGDDGISHHEGCSGFIDGGEWAYNHSGGITPSFGCQIDVRNVYAHHNGVGINWLGLSAQSRQTKMCDCIAIDNTTDIYVKWYVVTAWNNIFRTKDSQYSSARSRLIEYGTVTPE